MTSSRQIIASRCGIRYDGTMSMRRLLGTIAVGMIVVGCATGHAVSSVPLDQRLAARFGHHMDVAHGAEAPRNLQWEEERLRINLNVGRYLDQHPATPPLIAEALRHQTVAPGLTKEQVQLLWGPPDRVRRGKAQGQEFWYYRIVEQPQRSTTVQLTVCEGLVECITRP